MDRTNVPRRLLRVVGRLAACAASVSLICTAPAFADQLEQHNELVNKFVNDMHADPLVADCAAHGNFVASTSSAFDHVEFPPSSFDSAHASVTPWNDSFDEGKQRVKVDNIVTVEGLGIRQNGDSNDPADLKFRCGYVGNQMLAFSWNDPVPPARPSVSKPSGKHKGGKGKHSTGNKSSANKSSGKSSKKSTSSKSSGKSGSKKTSAKKKQ
jgi:hypothetical protein